MLEKRFGTNITCTIALFRACFPAVALCLCLMVAGVPELLTVQILASDATTHRCGCSTEKGEACCCEPGVCGIAGATGQPGGCSIEKEPCGRDTLVRIEALTYKILPVSSQLPETVVGEITFVFLPNSLREFHPDSSPKPPPFLRSHS